MVGEAEDSMTFVWLSIRMSPNNLHINPCNIVERESEAKMRISKQHSSLCFGHSRTQHSNYPTIAPRCAEQNTTNRRKYHKRSSFPINYQIIFGPLEKLFPTLA